MQANHNIISSREIINLLYKEGGIPRFWKGASIIAAGCIPAHASYFSIYEYSKKLFGVDESGFQFLAAAVTGALSTAVHDIIITPSDGK